MTAAESLFEQAMALPVSDRMKLASDILASVDDDYMDPAEIERLWAAECERRVAQLDAGEVDLLTWEEVLAEIEADRTANTAE